MSVSFIRSFRFALGALLALTWHASSFAQAAPSAPSADPSTPAASADAPASRLDALLEQELGSQGGLTADVVAERAHATSFEVEARRAELRAAAADVDQALSAYAPSLTLTGRYTRLSPVPTGGAGNLVVAPGAPAGPLPDGTQLVNVPLAFPILQNQYLLQASLLVPVSDYFSRVAPANAAARSAERAARWQLTTAEARAHSDAKIAYYAWVRARLGVLVAEQAHELAQAHLTDARRALEAGTASPADVARLESQVARSELLLESSRNLSRLAEQQLRTAMHDRSGAPYRIGEDIREPLPVRPLPPLSTLWAEAREHRPELRALAASAVAIDDRADSEQAGSLPRFDLFANAAYANPNPRVFPQRDEFQGTWDAGAQLTWVLSDVPAAQARVQATRSRSSAIRAERRALEDRVVVEVTAAVQALQESEVAVRTTERGLAAAEESHRVRRLLYRAGRATSVELLDAETELTRARLDALNARIEARAARVRLDYALGRVRSRR